MHSKSKNFSSLCKLQCHMPMWPHTVSALVVLQCILPAGMIITAKTTAIGASRLAQVVSANRITALHARRTSETNWSSLEKDSGLVKCRRNCVVRLNYDRCQSSCLVISKCSSVRSEAKFGHRLSTKTHTHRPTYNR